MFQFFLKSSPLYCHIQTYPHICTLFATVLKFFSVGILFSGNIVMFMVFMYTIRESMQSIFSSITSGAVALIFSEALLFIAYFWGMFTFSWSSSYDYVILPSSRSLVLDITIILATASVMLGYIYCLRTYLMSDVFIPGLIFTIVLGGMFCTIEITEFNIISIYINNSIYGSCILFLTGLHFTHVIVGVIMLLMNTNSTSTIFKYEVSQLSVTNSLIISINQVEWFVLLYWHFVELVWLLIQFVIYGE